MARRDDHHPDRSEASFRKMMWVGAMRARWVYLKAKDVFTFLAAHSGFMVALVSRTSANQPGAAKCVSPREGQDVEPQMSGPEAGPGNLDQFGDVTELRHPRLWLSFSHQSTLKSHSSLSLEATSSERERMYSSARSLSLRWASRKARAPETSHCSTLGSGTLLSA